MSLRILSSYNYNSYINNFASEKIGLYFSFFLHCLILLIVIGLPNFFGPTQIHLPNIIPIEIVNVSDITSIPKEVEKNEQPKITKEILKKKKFNNAENQIIKKVEVKTKPESKTKNIEITNNPIPEKVIKKKINVPVKLNQKKNIIEEEKFESLPSQKIKPKIKPKLIEEVSKIKQNTDTIVKVQPKQKPKPEFNIASMLKDLRNEQSSLIEDSEEKKETKKNELSTNKDKNNEISQLSISEIDLLIQQLSSCWNAPAGAVIKKGMVVRIEAKIKPDRKILENSIRIIDTNIPQNNPFYGPITESAMRTLMNPTCIPLKLPEEKYNLWKELIITFDHSIMKGY